MDDPEKIGTSSRETDRLAYLIFRSLEGCSTSDKQLVLNALTSAPAVDPSRAVLIREAIARFENECGGRLSKRRYETWRVNTADKSLPSATFIANTYGRTWSKAMDALGKQPAMNHAAFRLRAQGSSPSSEQVLKDLVECAAELGTQSLRFGDYSNWARAKQPHAPLGKVYLLSSTSFSNRFKSFRRALFLAGLRPVANGRSAGAAFYSEDSSIRHLQLASEEVSPSGALTMYQYDQWRRGKYARAAHDGEWLAIPSFHTIRYRFGSWPAALAAAELIPAEVAANYSRGGGKTMPPGQVADGLLRASSDLGGRFSSKAYMRWRAEEVKDLSKVRPASSSIVQKRFGGWVAAMVALKAAMQSSEPSSFLADVIREGGSVDGE